MRIHLLLAAVLLGLGLMVGCKNTAQVDALRAAAAGDLITYSETQGQLDNRITRTSYHNLRGANDDLMRILLLERPSRSVHYPVE